MKLLLSTLLATTARFSSHSPLVFVRAFSTNFHTSLIGGCSRNQATSTKGSSNPLLWRSKQQQQHRLYSSTTTLSMAKKAGVADLDELASVVEAAGSTLLVVDVRNPNADAEPGDQKSLAVAGLPSSNNRPLAKHYVWSRESDKLVLSEQDEAFLNSLPKDTAIITHCGGGGRGQKAKDYLVENYEFTNVHNGAGPKETELWQVYGDK